MKPKNYLILFIFPLLLIASAIFLNNSRGPYWLGSNSDPEYVYLLNSLNLATLQGVGHIDHPGTTVQVLGAVTLRIVHWTFGSGEFSQDVLKRPEFYLKAINTVMLGMNTLVLFLIGVAALHSGLAKGWALWLQAAPFFSSVLLQFGLTRVTPEPFLLFTGSLLIIMILLTLGNFQSFTNKPMLPLLLFALIIGLGTATKITFAPLAVIPLFLLIGIRKRIYYCVAALGGFMLFTLPIIRMYPKFFGWIFKLISHSGQYGSGPSGLAAGGQLVGNGLKLLIGNPFFSIPLITSVLFIVMVMTVSPWRRVMANCLSFKMSAAVATAQVLGLLMVAKHSAFHYLLPVMTLTGLSVVLFFKNIQKLQAHIQSGLPMGLKFKTTLFILYFGILFIASDPPGNLLRTGKSSAQTRELSLNLHQRVLTQYPDSTRIYYYRSSAPEYALKFGSDLARSYHAAQLEKLYPNVYFYDIWTQRYAGFDYNKEITPAQIKTRSKAGIVYQGSKDVKIKNVAPLFPTQTYETAYAPQN